MKLEMNDMQLLLVLLILPIAAFAVTANNAYGHMDSHEVDHEWKISLLQLLNGLQYAQQLYNNPGTYNLNTHNCTDMALGAATAVGVTIQAAQGTWPKGGGFNPGDLGEDLRALQ